MGSKGNAHYVVGKHEAPERIREESGSENKEGNDGHMFDETGGVREGGGDGTVVGVGGCRHTANSKTL